MNIFHYIFSTLTYFIYKIIKLLNFDKKNSLRVVMYHDIKKKDFSKFNEQINIIKKDGWKFLNPNKLDKFKKNKIYGKNIILTFDDGFFSNFLIEKQILSKHKIKAAYFIPYNFMMMKNRRGCISFIKKRLKIKSFKSDFKNKINMNLNDVLRLSSKKHSIGFHTKNHLELSKIKSEKTLKNEIAGKMNKKFEKIIHKNKLFSYPFGKISDISENSYKIANKKYKFIFLGIRGENKVTNIKQKLIFRDNFMTIYNKKMLLSILNGYFDLFYLFKRNNILKRYIKFVD